MQHVHFRRTNRRSVTLSANRCVRNNKYLILVIVVVNNFSDDLFSLNWGVQRKLQQVQGHRLLSVAAALFRYSTHDL